MKIDLAGKSALVTGSTRGIGRAIAESLAGAGARVGVVGRDEGRAKEAAAAISPDARGFACDVADIASVTAAVEAAEKEFGGVDILVNNAGLTRDGVLARMSDDDWRAVIETNLSSVFYTCRAVTRGMMKRRSGSIVNVSSIVGVRGNWGQSNYGASKAGIMASRSPWRRSSAAAAFARTSSRLGTSRPS
jgi:3-oxoacyl-[acyl-carrier protein] reductase